MYMYCTRTVHVHVHVHVMYMYVVHVHVWTFCDVAHMSALCRESHSYRELWRRDHRLTVQSGKRTARLTVQRPMAAPMRAAHVAVPLIAVNPMYPKSTRTFLLYITRTLG